MEYTKKRYVGAMKKRHVCTAVPGRNVILMSITFWSTYMYIVVFVYMYSFMSIRLFRKNVNVLDALVYGPT